MSYHVLRFSKMLFSVVLFLAANAMFADGQDCGMNKVLLDPGQTGVSISKTTNGLYLTPFPMPVTIYNSTGNMLHVSVYKDTKTCFDVSGEPNCVDDLRVFPNDLAVDAPPIQIGTVFYKHTTNENELADLGDYLCPGFKARQAVVITYSCLAEKPHDKALTVQVILTIVKDTDGITRTILLIKLALSWEENGGSFVEVGTRPYFKSFYKYTNDTLVFDVTYLNGWDSSPQRVPEIPATCPVRAVHCTVPSNTRYLADGKIVLLEWNTGRNNCKFKWIARVINAQVMWVRISVGHHKNPKKYFRLIDFNREKGKITQRGWKCKEGCRGEITTFDYDIADDGTVYATVREIVPGGTYVIDSELCSYPKGPHYKFTYNFNATGSETLTKMAISLEFLMANVQSMTGVCVA